MKFEIFNSCYRLQICFEKLQKVLGINKIEPSHQIVKIFAINFPR